MSDVKQIRAAIVTAIANKATRAEVALIYAQLLKCTGGDVDLVGDINRAIMRHWSPSGLVFIKEKAWSEHRKEQA
jgi:hypothetical protein